MRERLPEEFLLRIRDLLPEKEYQAFLSSYGRKRFFSLRVNPLKCTPERFLELMEPALQALTEPYGAVCGAAGAGQAAVEPGTGVGVGQDAEVGAQDRGRAALVPVPWEPDGFYYPEELRPGRHPRHEAGMYYIQEASAMAPAVLCGARPGDRVLDLCAAPGGKSTKLAACLRGQGLLVANEIHPERAKILASNLERMGVRNAVVTNETPQRLASRFPLFFDRILVDAPCSGEGMFRKEEAALAQWSLENIQLCARRQKEILEEAAAMLRPGGILAYSTCTFAPEENEDVIRWFLEEHPSFSLIEIPGLPGVDTEGWGFSPGSLPGTVRLWPHRLQGEGHFAALLQKEGRPDRRPAGGEDRAEPLAAASAGTGGRSSRKLYGPGEKEDRNKEGRKKESRNSAGRNKRGQIDPGRVETVRLWRAFQNEALLPPDPAAGPVLWDLPEDRLLLFGDALYACPVPQDSLSLAGLRVLCPGLQLGRQKKGRFVPAHALGMALHGGEVRRFIDFSGESPAASAWIRGEAIPVGEEQENGWTLVMIDGCAAGWGKVSGGMLKNHYPKGLRR